MKIASMIPPDSSVIDIGSGNLNLKKYLKGDFSYQPCDLIKQEGVLFCDFNSRIYPEIDKIFDYVVISGVFEYSRYPGEFLANISKLGKNVILSYADFRLGDSIKSRSMKGWVNNFSQAEIERLFNDSGLAFNLAGVWERQLIYEVNKTK